MVKHFIRKQSKGDDLPKGLPLREEQIQHNQKIKPVGKAIMPTEQEWSLMSVQEVRSYALRREYNGKRFRTPPLYKVIFGGLALANKLLIVLTILVVLSALSTVWITLSNCILVAKKSNLVVENQSLEQEYLNLRLEEKAHSLHSGYRVFCHSKVEDEIRSG